MTSTRLPLHQRLLPVLGVAFGAPICGEFLQAYLPSTGDAGVMLLSLLILAPLYGGAALLIREVTVRRGLGWPGLLLLAGAFGVAMPGLVDVSLFTEHRDDIAYWDQLRQGTLVAPLGISVYPAMSWVAGHVLMSIGAPLAIVDVVAPRHRGRPLLGWFAIATTAALCVLAAVLIRDDVTTRPSLAQTGTVAAIVVALVVLGLTRTGRAGAPRARPLEQPSQRRAVRPGWVLGAGAVGMFCVDVLPPTWAGAAGTAVLLAAGTVLVAWWAARTDWSAYQIGVLAAGGLTGRTAIGLLAPLPDGVSLAAKLGQNLVLLAATVALAWLVLGRRRPATAAQRQQVPDAQSGTWSESR